MEMIFAAALALLQPPEGEAVNWFLTGRTDSGSAWYADLDTAAVAQGVARIPIYIDHSQDGTESAHTIRATMVITCRHRVYQLENHRAYRADGAEMPERYIGLSGVDNIPPDSTANTLWQRFCPTAAR
jgi:hypothetical protein